LSAQLPASTVKATEPTRGGRPSVQHLHRRRMTARAARCRIPRLPHEGTLWATPDHRREGVGLSVQEDEGHTCPIIPAAPEPRAGTLFRSLQCPRSPVTPPPTRPRPGTLIQRPRVRAGSPS